MNAPAAPSALLRGIAEDGRLGGQYSAHEGLGRSCLLPRDDAMRIGRTQAAGMLILGGSSPFPFRMTSTFTRYVAVWSASALRAKLVERAEDWKWCRGVSMETRSGKGAIPVGGLALGSSSWLGRSCEQPANGCGTGGLAWQRLAWLPARRRVVDAEDREKTGAGKHASSSRETKETSKRFLTRMALSSS